MLNSIFRIKKRNKVSKFSIKIETTSPLTVEEFSNYLLNINDSYKMVNPVGTDGKDVELSIERIKEGSIIIEFINQGAHLLESANVYTKMVLQLWSKYKVVANKNKIVEDLKEKKLTKTELELLSKSTSLNRDKVEQLIFINGDNNNVSTNILDKKQVEQIQDNTSNGRAYIESINNKKDQVKEPELYQSVGMVFHTVTNPTNGNDKEKNKKPIYVAKIDSISKDSSYKLEFLNEEIREYFDFTEHPFNQEYLVSVRVYYNKNKSIAKYEVIEYLGIKNDLVSIMEEDKK